MREMKLPEDVTILLNSAGEILVGVAEEGWDISRWAVCPLQI